ncbi:LytR/AlgR family response regulator transcription factor [Cellulosilyticum sp. I15G10I2]|uniref:LytR/AlgR family response regulator transcription factor n=1 Tax=Cellulosilyticum sp. I15G10I2 TaxID=1892843 RepID=UPI00085C1A13|nr:LytTR family DNA-binding domain-containing protein [Cellulosilyticum sp. I15G10I2]
MIKVIVVDDEKPAVDELVYMLKAYEEVEIAGAFTDPAEALDFIRKTSVDVVFLDISMPEIDGFMLAEVLIKLTSPPLIVFATAYDEYAVQAFEIHAIDYVLKPLTEGRLLKTINRITKQLQQKKSDMAPIRDMLNTTQNPKRYNKLPVWKNDRIYLIDKHDILFCTTNESETAIVTLKERFITSDTLADLENQLDDKVFFRCHRSYIIRLEAVSEIIPWFNNTYAVKFQGCKEEVPISRRNTKLFKTLMCIK